jgi:hypothetical protein
MRQQLIENVQGHPHKLYMDVLLSSGLFNDLTKKKKKINCCGAVGPNRNEMPQGSAYCLLSVGFLLDSPFNIGGLDYMVLHPRI